MSELENICSICLSQLNDDQIELECAHVLHRKCLVQLIISSHEKNQVYRCPLCRTELKDYKDISINDLRKRYVINEKISEQDLDQEIVLRTEQLPLLVIDPRISRTERKKTFIKTHLFCASLIILLITGIAVFVNYSESHHSVNFGNHT